MNLPGKNQVIVERKQILALVVCLLSEDAEHGKVERCVCLVSAGFLTLAKVFSAVLFDVREPYSIVDGAHSGTCLEVVDGLVDGGLIVAENANGMQRGEVGEIPLYVVSSAITGATLAVLGLFVCSHLPSNESCLRQDGCAESRRSWAGTRLSSILPLLVVHSIRAKF